MKADNRVVIDTNLLVRYLTNDEPQKAKAVEKLLIQAEKGDLKILIPSIVIAELIWVLESFYKMKAGAIAELVEAILNTPGIDVTDKKILTPALKLYKIDNIDFIDAWIAEFARQRDVRTIYTFDRKHFKNVEGITTESLRT